MQFTHFFDGWAPYENEILYFNIMRKQCWSKRGQANQRAANGSNAPEDFSAHLVRLEIYYELLPCGQTLGTDHDYRQMDRLMLEIGEKRPAELCHSIWTMSGHVRLQWLASGAWWEVLIHPPYSLQSSTGWLLPFLVLENLIGCKKSSSREGLIKWIIKSFLPQDEDLQQRDIEVTLKMERSCRTKRAYLNGTMQAYEVVSKFLQNN